jgi:hypothetical protein
MVDAGNGVLRPKYNLCRVARAAVVGSISFIEYYGFDMSWSDIGEIIKAVASVLTVGVASTAAWIAWRGLEKWRFETTGKRRAEIAEATLAHAYEMQEILRSARSPTILPHEAVKNEGVPDEIVTNPNYVPEARLLAYQEFFGRFRSQKYVFVAVFGAEAAEPLDELWRIRMEISQAVDVLLLHEKLSKEDESVRAYWDEKHAIAFSPRGYSIKGGGFSKDHDPLGSRIFEQVYKLEKICRPAIEARPL